MKLKKELDRVRKNSEFKINIIEMNDDNFKKRYRIQNIPALVIDGKVVSEGKILCERELKKMIFLYNVS